MVISLNREPATKLPFVEPWSFTTASCPAGSATRCLRETALSERTRSHEGDEPTEMGSSRSATVSPRSGPWMTTKVPPVVCRVNAGWSSRRLVTLVTLPFMSDGEWCTNLTQSRSGQIHLGRLARLHRDLDLARLV